MKGNIKITVEVKDEVGSFPITETFTIERDNTYESIEDWIEVFKKMLYNTGFTEERIERVFDGEE